VIENWERTAFELQTLAVWARAAGSSAFSIRFMNVEQFFRRAMYGVLKKDSLAWRASQLW
jgi:hypothetical protein